MLTIFMILSVLFIFFLIRYLLLKKDLQHIVQQLKQSNKIVTISTKDATVEKLALQINNQLAKKEKTLAEKKRLEREIKRTIADMSHDLRTPLTAMIGYLELMDEEQNDHKNKKYLDTVKKRTIYLNNLVNNFFSLSAVATEDYPLQLEKINVSELLKEILLSYYDQFQMERKPPQLMIDDHVFLITDKNSLYRVIENLLLNALQHATGDIQITLTIKKQKVIFSVKNCFHRDERIDPEKVFDHFFTTDQSRQQRRGLGLPIVKNLMDKMNGKVYVLIENDEFHIACTWPALSNI